MNRSNWNSPEPDDGEDAAGQDDEVAEEVSKWHTRENGERSVQLFQQVSSTELRSLEKDRTHNSTHSTVDSNDETHDGVTQDTGTDGHSPAEADGDDGGSCTTKRLSIAILSRPNA